jgi:hypothetical protein
MKRNSKSIDDLTDAGLALAALWLMLDPSVVYTIPITFALTLGWCMAYREIFRVDGES